MCTSKTKIVWKQFLIIVILSPNLKSLQSSVYHLTDFEMVTKFERWGLLFKPQVFNTFTVSNQNETEEFIIQDLPQDRIEEASNFMLEYYVKDETFQMATKVPKKALMDFYRFVFEQKVSLACFKKNSGELVGLNALTVKSKDVDTNFEVNLKNIVRIKSYSLSF